jgi:hypothetical protein
MEDTTSAEGDTRMIECTAVSTREGGGRERCRGRERGGGEVSEKDREVGEREGEGAER